MNRQRSVEELNEIISMLRREVRALKRYVAFLENEMRKLKGDDWKPPSEIPRVSRKPTILSSLDQAELVSEAPTEDDKLQNKSPFPSSDSRDESLQLLSAASAEESASASADDFMLDPVSLAEIQLEMKKLLISSTSQIEQLQEELNEVSRTHAHMRACTHARTQTHNTKPMCICSQGAPRGIGKQRKDLKTQARAARKVVALSLPLFLHHSHITLTKQ